MLKINFDEIYNLGCKILCLGAHCDDIQIGCGGTILKLLSNNNNLSFFWVVFSSDYERKKEALQSAHILLERARQKNIIIHNFRESFFPYHGAEIKEHFEKLQNEFAPDLIFTHFRNDLHQDHRIISDLTWNTFRDHLILEYEVPKYDGDLGRPNFFVHLNESLCSTKVKHLVEIFKTQAIKQWFSEDVFLALLRLRGIESNAPHKFAEAFHCRKIVF